MIHHDNDSWFFFSFENNKWLYFPSNTACSLIFIVRFKILNEERSKELCRVQVHAMSWPPYAYVMLINVFKGSFIVLLIILRSVM